MYKITIDNFDLLQIAESGQCFRMKRTGGNSYGVIALDTYLEVWQEGQNFTFSCGEEEFNCLWAPYFDLDRDYGSLKDSVEKEDHFLQTAISCGGGIRILKQELWEVIITFIISQRNNIPRIKKIVELLCENFGEAKHYADHIYYTFPAAERLAELKLSDLSGCNLGYRDKYVLSTAAAVAEGRLNLSELKTMSYEDAKRELLGIYGIGIKVAECICLYGLHHVGAFPVDTHVQKILAAYYPKGFPFARYRGYAGILQQYGFYYELHGEKANLRKTAD